jgi:two-component SAPR family response regulator
MASRNDFFRCPQAQKGDLNCWMNLITQAKVLPTVLPLLDLVVLDIKINPAYGGGLEVLKEIKTFDNKIQVILNSAYTTFRADFSTWLADAYVIKSSDLTELKRRIKELLHLD